MQVEVVQRCNDFKPWPMQTTDLQIRHTTCVHFTRITMDRRVGPCQGHRYAAKRPAGGLAPGSGIWAKGKRVEAQSHTLQNKGLLRGWQHPAARHQDCRCAAGRTHGPGLPCQSRGSSQMRRRWLDASEAVATAPCTNWSDTGFPALMLCNACSWPVTCCAVKRRSTASAFLQSKRQLCLMSCPPPPVLKQDCMPLPRLPYCPRERG
jgi:hypothetical protein